MIPLFQKCWSCWGWSTVQINKYPAILLIGLSVRTLVVTHSSLKWTLLVLRKCCDVIVIGTHQAHCRESQTPDTSLWFCDTYSLRPVSISLYHVHSHGDLREQPASHSVDVARLQYKWPKIEVIEYACVVFFLNYNHIWQVKRARKKKCWLHELVSRTYLFIYFAFWCLVHPE